MNQARNIVGLLFLLCVYAVAEAATLPFGPFQGVDIQLLKPEERLIITEASEDFEAVKIGQSPKHAKFDRDVPLPADGGTTFYVGRGYKLTVVKSLSSFGALRGFVYGPVVTFDESFARGNENTISSLRFYSAEQLKSLLGK